MRYEIVKIEITPKNIGKFSIVDDRVKHPKFIKDRKHLEEEMVAFQKKNNTNPDYPERYDLTVFTYNQLKLEWLIVDGSHRLEGLKRIFKRKELKKFNAILIPSNVISANTLDKRVYLSRRLDFLLRKEGLPTWVKKFDFHKIYHESVASSLFLKSDFEPEIEYQSWSNKNRIDEGSIDAEVMPIDEYQKSREL